jgi:hypothetical protein
VIPLFKGDVSLRERSHLIEIIGLLSKRIVHKAQERGRAWYEAIADTKAVGRLEESALETAIPAERRVKTCAP